MRKTIILLSILLCCGLCTESIQCQDALPNHLLPQQAQGAQVPPAAIKAPVVTTLKPPIQTTAKLPQVITKFKKKIPLGPLSSEPIQFLETKYLSPNNAEYPDINPLVSQPFLAGVPEKVLAEPMLKKNTGPDVVLTYDLSNGLKDLTIEKMYQDQQGNLWATTVYGGVFKFDGKYFHYMAEEQGLSSNTVLEVLFTSNQEIWFGTLDGLSKYDGKYITNYTTENGLKSNWIVGLDEDKYGNIWILTHKDLQMIDKATQTIYSFNLGFEKFGTVRRELKKDVEGNIWFSFGENSLAIISCKKNGATYDFKFNYYHHNLSPIRVFLNDQKGNMWAVAEKSLYKISNNNNNYKNLTSTDYDQKMNASIHSITNIDEDDESRIWFSTRRKGVFILDLESEVPSYRNLLGPYDIPDAFVSGIFCDNKQNIWMASDGLSLIKKRSFQIFDLINSPTAMVEDFKKNMWIGSADGLYKYNPKQPDTILLYSKKEGLPSSSIGDMIIDKNGHIWIASLGDGIIIFEPNDQNQKGIFKHYTRANGIPSEFNTAFIEDKNKDIWFSSYENSVAPTSGVAKIIDNQMTFIGVNQGLIHEDVMAMDYDIFGNFWIGTWGLGLNQYVPDAKDGKAQVVHFTSKQLPIENRVRTVEADQKGNVWTGGYGAVGITQFLPSKNNETNEIRHYSLAQGLSSTNLMSALEDDKGNLWFGTGYGLNLLEADQVQKPTDNRPIIAFTLIDGFPARACENNVLFQSDDGLIWVGGDDRLIYFDPKELIKKSTPPSVSLLDVSLFNQTIHWKKDTSYVLDNGKTIQDFSFDSLSHFDYLPKGLTLAYHNNFIDFDYTGNYVDENHNLIYQTTLEGLEKDWTSSTKETKISYNGLRHGEYLFKVRAKIKNGAWGTPLEFPFIITPPIWQTWWAYLIYTISAILLLFTFYRLQLNRNLEKVEAIRLRELDTVKTRLYTNITHEFRTPLTVISGITDQIKENPKEWLKEGLPMIQRNANRLLELVNQLLNLSKIESGKTTLHLEQRNIITYLKYLVESIDSFAESKNVQLHFFAEEEEVIMDYDFQKIEQLVINLLSNAVKFTPSSGHVYMNINLIKPSAKGNILKEIPSLKISVRDNGPGIPEDQIPFIFDRFYQVDDSSTRQGEGSGIGLALVKELIILMKGEISVKSKLGKETTFTVILPISNEAPEVTTLSMDPTSFKGPFPENESPISLPKNGQKLNHPRPKVLLIEDNRDVAAYIANCLQNDYEIKIGSDGQEGIDIAFESTPDLILTDVMMPIKDGFTVCNTLKNDERTSHIPIIMLTAKTDIESKLTGLEKGADAYLAKPFHKQELLIRIKKLLELRQRLHGYYLSIAAADTPSEIKNSTTEIPKADADFINRLKSYVEINIDDVDLNVEKIYKALGMSRSQLHRKTTALTGLSPNKFIRFIRLNKAKIMLKDPDNNISEVAYQLGFNDPSYFGRVFKKEFGKTPQQWREEEGVV